MPLRACSGKCTGPGAGSNTGPIQKLDAGSFAGSNDSVSNR